MRYLALKRSDFFTYNYNKMPKQLAKLEFDEAVGDQRDPLSQDPVMTEKQEEGSIQEGVQNR